MTTIVDTEQLILVRRPSRLRRRVLALANALVDRHEERRALRELLAAERAPWFRDEPWWPSHR